MDWKAGQEPTQQPDLERSQDKQAKKPIITKNRSLHERAQSSEFKALFNNYLKKRQNSNQRLTIPSTTSNENSNAFRPSNMIR